ncbi:RmlC-like cupin domain-containing protein [Apiosordaria backusii]|uniref:RmlC-like cupin domain-containing protein n=1 Tax=Apiosordaria backusii TaxID=314023 RepID=A0AA40BKU7_9PEZI|nr:RmlC-like cupin domain-containing protein [Apiosordaria backusii]
MAAPSSLGRRSTPLSLTAQLQIADTAVDRANLLPEDKDYVYDFSQNPGQFADRKTFPALVGTGGSLAVGTLPPCGMAPLHIHPRSAELFAVIEGRILTEAVIEAGVVDADGKQRVIRTDLTSNTMTIFPKGAFHTQMNPECTNATVAAAFPSEDPGIGLILPQTFALDDEWLKPLLGDLSTEEIAKLRASLPTGLFLQVEECQKRCGIQKE